MNSISEFPSTGTEGELSIEQAIKSFNSAFPDDDSCYQHLFDLLLSKSLRCPNCKGSALERKRGRRAYCLNCRKSFSFTADTFFARIRKIRVWLLAIHFMEQGMVLSANHLHRLLDIALSSAWEMKRKIDCVLQNLLIEQSVALPASEFAAVVCRRSIHTPAGKHPASENTQSESPSCGSESGNVCAMAGQVTRIVGFVRAIFHGISYKYLQLTLASLGCIGFKASTLPTKKAILELCLEHDALSGAFIKTYCSPALVLIPLPEH